MSEKTPSPAQSRAAAAEDTAATRRMHKSEWLNSFRGNAIKMPIEIHNPVVQNLFKRTFYPTARNMYSVLIFTPASVDEASAKKVEAHMTTRLDALGSEIQTRIDQAQKVLDDHGITEVADSLSPHTEEAVITTPLSNKHLHLFRQFNMLVRMMDTLWITGLCDTSARSKEIFEVKKALRVFAQQMRAMYNELQRQIARKQSQANAGTQPTKPVEDAASDSDDANAGEDSPPASAAKKSTSAPSKKKPQADEPASTPAADDAVTATEDVGEAISG